MKKDNFDDIFGLSSEHIDKKYLISEDQIQRKL
jgi:hypothetical protein